MDDSSEPRVDVAELSLANEKDKNDVVILEVSSVGGRQSTKLIEPVSKKRKIEPLLDNVRVTRGKSKLLNEPIPKKSVSDDPCPVNGMPIMVNQGNTSQLMYLYSSPRTGTTPSKSKRANENVLIERLEIRIKELEMKISEQKELHKQKMAASEDIHRRKVQSLTQTISQLKAQASKVPARAPKTSQTRVEKSCDCSNSTVPEQMIYSVLKDRFSPNQIKAIVDNDAMIRWDDSELLKAFTLRCISYGAYIFLRDQLKYPLPSMKYLSRWLNKQQPKKTEASQSAEIDVDVNDDKKFAEPGCSDDVSNDEMFVTGEMFETDDGSSQDTESAQHNVKPNPEEVEFVVGDDALDKERVMEYIVVNPRNDSVVGNRRSKFVVEASAESEGFHYLAKGDSDSVLEEVYIVRENDDDVDRIESEHCYQLSVQGGQVEQ